MQLIFTQKNEKQPFQSTLDELARQGAQKILSAALEAEASEYVEKFKSQLDSVGHRMVVKNGKGKNRNLLLGCGEISLEVPRVNDRREGHKFTSKILPPYLRKSPNIESVLPILYLKGLSTKDFEDGLASLLGDGVKGLSAASIVNLKKTWEKELMEWSKRPITEPYVYIWVDGVHVNIRLGEDKSVCLLVVIGVNPLGKKQLLAVKSGWRESKDSWAEVLRDLKKRGLKAPLLAVGDGALGFWAALREVEGFECTKSQRCWFHKMGNILNDLPKRLQGKAKEMLYQIMYAENRRSAEIERGNFKSYFQEKFPKAVDRLEKDWDALTRFFEFPAQTWKHLRTTNPIESAFATVAIRTKVTKGAGSKEAAEAMAFKLLKEAEKRWHRIDGFKEIQNLLNGVEYKDGIVLHTKASQEAISA
jgi:transposase-like protein